MLYLDMIEKWKKVKDTNNVFISNLGNIMSKKTTYKYVFPTRNNGQPVFASRDARGKIPTLSNQGYYQVRVITNGKSKHMSIHRLVAIAFLPNPYGYTEINHKDGVKTNNNYNNLEWCTKTYNQHHAVLNGLKPTKLNLDLAREIRKLYILGIRNMDLAILFKVSRQTISSVLYKRVWDEDKLLESI